VLMEASLVAIALTAIGTFLGGLWLVLTRAGKKIIEFNNQHIRSIVSEQLTVAIDRIAEDTEARVAPVWAELRLNGGSTLRDAVARLEVSVNQHRDDSKQAFDALMHSDTAIRNRLGDLEERVDGLPRQLKSSDGR
jgi:hypothetical protein